MFKPISRELLKAYFYSLKYKLIPGKDRVTKVNFENNLDTNLDLIINKISKRTYKFSPLKEFTNDKGRTIYIPTIRDRLVLEFLKDRLKLKYKINMPDRNLLIYNLKSILSDELDYYIIRLDIKSFFSSISQEILFDRIKSKTLLNSEEYYLLYKLLEVSPHGLPEGLSVSNYLAEIYLESFDIKLKTIHNNIFFYSRYVDDILLIIPGKLKKSEIDELKDKIKNIFNHYNLSIDLNNPHKNSFIEFYKNTDTSTLYYLGYSFKRNNNNTLSTSINKDKLKNYHKKLDLIFKDFNYNNNFYLLYERLYAFSLRNKILKTKVHVRKDASYYSTNQSICYGVVENYSYADFSSFEKLDNHIHNKLHDIYPLIRNRDLKRKFHSISITNSKKNDKVLIYDKIPRNVLETKINNIDPSLDVNQLTTTKLIKIYFDFLNNY